MLREELQLLQEQGSYVGEVIKVMDKKKVLVKVRIFVYCLRIILFWAILFDARRLITVKTLALSIQLVYILILSENFFSK
jgi:ATP-dependent 26S proteasome regulatory subunit